MAEKKHVIEYTDIIKAFEKVKEKLKNKSNKGHQHGNADITDIDASKIKSGTIDIDRLPKGAIERMVYVKDDVARFALTTNTTQNGDTVKVTSTKKMFYVIDDTKLSSEAGYELYTAESASAVPWSGVTGKPTTFTPEAHTHAISEVADLQETLTGLRQDVNAKPSKDTNTTYSLIQDSTDGHKLTFKGSDGSTKTVTIPDNDHNDNTWRDVVDSLESTRADASLSANQGRILNGKFAGYLPLHGTADIATSVTDYGDTAKHIQIGFSGAGITGDDIKYIAGYTGGDGSNLSAKIKDISKDALKSWLGLGSRAYDSTSYLPLSGGDMTGDITFNGYGASTIGNGSQDGAGLDAKNNLNIASWYGVSFTSKCAGFAYSDKPGVSIDCRNGTLAVAGAIYANGGVVGDLTGNATTATTANYANSAGSADKLAGFYSKDSSQTWGNQIGTFISGMGDSTGGSLAFRRDNPTAGQLSAIIDGYWYQNEGRFMCLDTNNYSSYALPLSGGTITGRIVKNTSGSWIGDRDRSVVCSMYPGDDGYGCVACMPTKNGSWSMGNLGGVEHLIFNYVPDANYSANKNESIHVYLRPTEGTIALTSDIPSSLPASDVYSWAKASSKPSYSWGEISGRPTALSSFTNDSGYITGITKAMVTGALGYTPPTTDTNTIYSASTGLNLSGTSFSVKYGSTAGTACQGNDSRLSNSRPASDVYSWAKASSKPSYTWTEISNKPDIPSISKYTPTRTNWTINSEYNCVVYRIGDFCLAVVAVTGTIYPRQWLPAAQLSKDFTPKIQSSIVVCSVSGSDHMECMVTKDGYIKMWWSGSSPATSANICVPYYMG